MKIMLRLTTTVAPLKSMRVGVRRDRTTITMLIIVNADALTMLYPFTRLFAGEATDTCSVDSIENALFTEILLCLIGLIVSIVSSEDAVRASESQ